MEMQTFQRFCLLKRCSSHPSLFIPAPTPPAPSPPAIWKYNGSLHKLLYHILLLLTTIVIKIDMNALLAFIKRNGSLIQRQISLFTTLFLLSPHLCSTFGFMVKLKISTRTEQIYLWFYHKGSWGRGLGSSKASFRAPPPSSSPFPPTPTPTPSYLLLTVPRRYFHCGTFC